MNGLPKMGWMCGVCESIYAGPYEEINKNDAEGCTEGCGGGKPIKVRIDFAKPKGVAQK